MYTWTPKTTAGPQKLISEDPDEAVELGTKQAKMMSGKLTTK